MRPSQMLPFGRALAHWVCGLAVACASPPKAPEPWQRAYGTRSDCRGTTGTECFLYFKFMQRTPDPICRAESQYPANARRRDCYATFQVADSGRLDPAELERTIATDGPDRLDALGTLFSQASLGDPRSHEVLRRLALTRLDLPRRAEALSWLAEHGDHEALDALARVLLEGRSRERLDWLPFLARLPGEAADRYLLDAVASKDAELAHEALRYAVNRGTLAQDQVWRAAFGAACRGYPEACRDEIRERLRTSPRDFLRTLERIASDPDVGPVAEDLLTMSIGGSNVSVDSLPDSRIQDLRLQARAGRLPAFLPRIEREAEVMQRHAEREREQFENLRFTDRILTEPGPSNRLYVGIESAQWIRDAAVLAEIRDAAGHSRWLLSDPHIVDGREYCEPLPGKCRFPPWMPEGIYLVFSDERPEPLFPVAGRYEVRFESPFRAFRHGPVIVETSAPR